MRGERERRAAGAQPGHRGAGRDLKPEDQVDEIVDHYPDACGGCGRRFDDGQRRPGGRFGRHQVCELPPISVIVIEHRTHQLRCRHCRHADQRAVAGVDRLLTVRAELAGGAGDLDRAAPDLSPWDHRARFGSVRRRCLAGTVDAICQRASDALAGPHSQLHDWVLDQAAVHVDETGWRTRGDGRALWTASTLERDVLPDRRALQPQAVPRADRPRTPGSWSPIAGSGLSTLTPPSGRCAGRTSIATSAATQKGSASRRSSANKASSSPAKCSPPGAPTSTSTTTATGSSPRSPRSRPSYSGSSKMPAPRASAPAGTAGSRTTCSRSGPRSGPS